MVAGRMNRKELIAALESLPFDKDKYVVISGGALVLYGILEDTEDVDIKMAPNIFGQYRKEGCKFEKTNKYDYLYRLIDPAKEFEVEVAVQDYSPTDVETVSGFTVVSLKTQLVWMLKNNRTKDQCKIQLIRERLGEAE